MKNRTFNWVTDSGINLFAQSWEPDAPSDNPVICLVHGLGEHSSRYVELPSVLAENGYRMLAFDLRGHGKSEGKRGHISCYQDFMKDIDLLVSKSNELFSGSDVFLYGHSMGGNLVLNYALRYKPELKGVIVTSPWLKLINPPSQGLIRIAKVLDKIWPALTTHNRLRSDDLSTQVKKQDPPKKDDLLHPWISIHTFLELAEASCWALERADNFPCPLLIMHGDADKVTSPEGSRDFHSKAGSKSTLKIITDLYHGIHNDPKSADVFETLLNWLKVQQSYSGKKQL